ncbi:YaaW family protein [Azohydromonas lata]|uniref:Ubiquinol-cytochrome C chaperone family protein n=1 Tax=Azohydromonas lata TaxID=45677 RepID=A0ABU5I982_9BURK|nr:ubiquinol-cytochrome C chaperone family protein [Azohydromonas lata]MDZ5455659.1 ubiquinol-cytochrome C chaperone family protein [Azohydromonas lata]
MSKYITTDLDLIGVLQTAEESDLTIISDYITDSGKGRISLDSSVRAYLEVCRQSNALSENINVLAKEIQDFGGNTIMNFFRGKGVPYPEIVEDVASHFKVKADKTESTESLETKILLAVAVKAMEKMSPTEQRDFASKISGGRVVGAGPGVIDALQAAVVAGGYGTYMLAAAVANGAAEQLLGRGLVLAANGALMRGIGAFAGPIGWAVTVIWALFDLASPAYRVTVPCVLQIAYLRQRSKETKAS